MLQGKRILICGASGFVGQRAAKLLHSAGARVVGIARAPPSTHDSAVELLALDMADARALRELVCNLKPQLIVHLAATRRLAETVTALRESYELNVAITLNLLEACLAGVSPERLVFLGSCDEYGCGKVPFEESMREAPVTPYGASKLASTQLLQLAARCHGFPAVILRPSVVYGPGQPPTMFLPALIGALLRGEEFAMSPGEQTRDYVYIDDLVEAIASGLALTIPAGTIINVSAGSPIQLRQLALMVAQCVGSGAAELLRPGALQYRTAEPMEYWVSNACAGRLLGWQPHTSLEAGIARTVASLRERSTDDSRAQP
jgi:nucleoside-diphosphate-sugar epimerase